MGVHLQAAGGLRHDLVDGTADWHVSVRGLRSNAMALVVQAALADLRATQRDGTLLAVPDLHIDVDASQGDVLQVRPHTSERVHDLRCHVMRSGCQWQTFLRALQPPLRATLVAGATMLVRREDLFEHLTAWSDADRLNTGLVDAEGADDDDFAW